MTLPALDLALLGRWLAARGCASSCATARAVVFTFAFPLVLLVLFNGLNGNATVDAVGAGAARSSSPSSTRRRSASSASTTACYTSVIIGIATARDTGLLKRVRGTPLPMAIYLGAWLTGAGADRHPRRRCCCSSSPCPAFGVTIYCDTLPAALVTLVLGAACLVVARPRGRDAGEDRRPGDADRAADVPADLVHLGHLVPARRRAAVAGDDRRTSSRSRTSSTRSTRCFSPGVTGGGWSASDLRSIAIWTVVGLFVAARRFRAEPAASRTPAPAVASCAARPRSRFLPTPRARRPAIPPGAGSSWRARVSFRRPRDPRAAALRTQRRWGPRAE